MRKSKAYLYIPLVMFIAVIGMVGAFVLIRPPIVAKYQHPITTHKFLKKLPASLPKKYVRGVHSYTQSLGNVTLTAEQWVMENWCRGMSLPPSALQVANNSLFSSPSLAAQASNTIPASSSLSTPPSTPYNASFLRSNGGPVFSSFCSFGLVSSSIHVGGVLMGRELDPTKTISTFQISKYTAPNSVSVPVGIEMGIKTFSLPGQPSSPSSSTYKHFFMLFLLKGHFTPTGQFLIDSLPQLLDWYSSPIGVNSPQYIQPSNVALPPHIVVIHKP